MKYAIVILDGAAGEPLDCFDGLTSLEKASTPFIDVLAEGGICGLSHNVPVGMEPGSQVACMSIMGYDPAAYDIGRGAIEGAALGVDLDGDEVAMRLNLCCVEDGHMKSYSTGNISSEDSYAMADELIAHLDDETFQLTKGTSFRHILRVKGYPALMDLVYTAPHNISDKPTEGCQPRPSDPGNEAQRAAALVICDYMERANEILFESQVNIRRQKEGLLEATNAWAFWPGMRPSGMKPFSEVYGLDAGMLSPVDLLRGLARLTGVQVYSAPGMTDAFDNDYASQGETALRILKEKDVVFIHCEAPDAAGHDGDPIEKVRAIEAIDNQIVSRLSRVVDTCDLHMLITPDHPTPVAVRTHTNQPVPYVMCGRGIAPSLGARLTERECASSGVVADSGWKLMGQLLE